MKSVKLDKKREWYEERVRFNKMLFAKASTHYKLLIQEHFNKDTMNFTPLYETPKEYDDQGVAYNKDKSWVVYKTIKNKKTTIFCKTKNKLLRTFISYMGFLKVAGIDNASVMYLFTLIFMDRLKWYQGLFDCTAENKKWLQSKILKVLEKSNDEITKNWTRNEKNRKGCWDERDFAMDTTGMSRSEVTRKQNKVMNKKEKTDKTIEKYYDTEKSIRKNFEILKENGVKCSLTRLKNWNKEHNQSGQNGDTSIKSEINESGQNGDTSISEIKTESGQNGDTSISEIKTESGQNGDTSISEIKTESGQNGDTSIKENDENGVVKTEHNSSYYRREIYKKEVEIGKEVEEEVRKEKEIIEEENNKRKRKIEEEKNKFFNSTDNEDYSNMTDNSYELDDLFKLLGA